MKKNIEEKERNAVKPNYQ